MDFAFCTVDLGFGDSGKGATVDFLCREYPIDLVVRYSGGFQAAHHVHTADGRSHCFSQFGSGTFAGVPTYIGPDVIISLPALMREYEHLIEIGAHVGSLENKLLINEHCLIGTNMAAVMNRLQEDMRRVCRGSVHGSCGVGIGVTREYGYYMRDAAIRLSDIVNTKHLRSKLITMYDELRNDLSLFDDAAEQFMIDTFAQSQLYQAFKQDLQTLCGASVLSQLKFTVVNAGNDALPCGYKRVVFEGAQGVLLDESHGTRPHTTWSDTTLRPAFKMLQINPHIQNNVTPDNVFSIGIMRSYMTRHGAGPLPTEVIHPPLHNHESNEDNKTEKYTGHMRYGILDLPLLRYSTELINGISADWGMTGLNYLAVNHLDQLKFPYSAAISYRKWLDEAIRKRVLGNGLNDISENEIAITQVISSDQLLRLIEDRLCTPVGICGFGKKAEDRIRKSCMPN